MRTRQIQRTGWQRPPFQISNLRSCGRKAPASSAKTEGEPSRQLANRGWCHCSTMTCSKPVTVATHRVPAERISTASLAWCSTGTSPRLACRSLGSASLRSRSSRKGIDRSRSAKCAGAPHGVEGSALRLGGRTLGTVPCSLSCFASRLAT